MRARHIAPTRTSTPSRLTAANVLSVVIVSSVVMINSVAWGIPLLIGSSDTGLPLRAGTGKIVANTPTPATREVVSLMAPLPQLAPAKMANRTARPAGSSTVTGTRAPPPLTNKPPMTFYPRPQPAPTLPPTTAYARLSFTAEPGDARREALGASDRERKPARGIVFVSPYAPGVRFTPDGGSPGWRLPDARAVKEHSTTDTAKAIARRAAKHDARSAAGAPRRGALLPVATRPPRIVDDGVGRMLAKSANSYVRPRLMRRPIGGLTVAHAATAVDPPVGWPNATSLPGGDDATRNLPARLATAIESERRADILVIGPVVRATASLPPQIGRDTAASDSEHSRTRAVAPRVRRLGGLRARSTRSRRTRPAYQLPRKPQVRIARRRGKIDGFKRSFHRQLVAANFFSPKN